MKNNLFSFRRIEPTHVVLLGFGEEGMLLLTRRIAGLGEQGGVLLLLAKICQVYRTKRKKNSRDDIIESCWMLSHV